MIPNIQLLPYCMIVFLYTFSFMLYVTHPLDPISGAQGFVGTPASYKTVMAWR